MKQFYQIHELAKLFDLCPDTLRYYEEKGLLHPVRGENRYRMYGIQDVCTLNIIRALRELKIPTRAIRAYLERRSVGETLSLLDREEALLRRRMAELEAALEEARARRAAAVAEEMHRSYLEGCVGRTYPVLFEQPKNGKFFGHAPNYMEVLVDGAELHNALRTVRITDVDGEALLGEIVEQEAEA